MRRNPRRNKIGTMIVISTIVTTMIAIVFTVVFLNYRFSDSIKYTTEKTSNQIVKSVSENIDSYISEMIGIASTVSNNIDKYVDGTLPFNFFSELPLRNDIKNILVVNLDGEVIFNEGHKKLKENREIREQEWFHTVIPGSNLYTITSPHVQQLYENDYSWVISLSRGLTWYNENDEKQYGIVVVELSIENIRKISSEEIGDNGYIFILDQNNEIVYHPQQQVIYAGAENKMLNKIRELTSNTEIINIDNKKFYVTEKRIKNADWNVVGVTPVINLFSYDDEIMSFILRITLMILGFVAFISIIAAKFITNPLHKLIQSMRRVEEGEIDIQSSISGLYEVEQLSTSFNRMIFEIQNLMQKVIQDQKELRKSEFKILYNQINPHFLYNTLDSIVWLAEARNYSDVIQMISSLADFFRLSLAKGREEVTVLEEINHVKSYLSIQKIRYSSQFEYEFNVDKSLEHLKSLKIILQPIVENSLKYAFGDAMEDGFITISAYTEDDNLIYKVEDNGSGIPNSILKNIQNNELNSFGSGIGLNNIDQRIKIMYGQQYGVKINSELEEGTTVVVILPIEKE